MFLPNTSGFPYSALVNVAIAMAALFWYFKRQHPLDSRAKVFRWVLVAFGTALFVYGNASTAISRNAAANCALIGGLLALNFLWFPQLADWAVRGLTFRKNR